MPIQPNTVDISLATGLDTKTDKKLAKGMLELENAYVEASGAIRKRPGFRALPRTIDAAGLSGSFDLLEGAALYSFKDTPVAFFRVRHLLSGEQTLVSGWRYHLFDKLSGRWTPVGEASRMGISLVPTVSGNNDAGRMTFAAVGATEKLLCTVYYEATNLKIYAVATTHDGVPVAKVEVATLTAAPSRVAVFGMLDGSFNIIYGGASDAIQANNWNVVTNTLSSAATLESTVGAPTSTTWECGYIQHAASPTDATSTDAVVIFYTDSDEIAKLLWVDTTPAVRRTVEVAGAGANRATPVGLWIAHGVKSALTGANDRPIWMAYHDAGTASTLRLKCSDADGSTLGTERTLAGVGTSTARFATFAAPQHIVDAIVKDDGTDTFTIGAVTNVSAVIAVNGISASTPIRYYYVKSGANPAALSFLDDDTRNADLFMAFTFGDEIIYPFVWQANINYLQQTVILRSLRQQHNSAASQRNYVSAAILRGSSGNQIDLFGGGTGGEVLSVNLPDGRVVLTALRQDRLPIDADAGATEEALWMATTICACILDPRPLPYPVVRVGDGLVIAGPEVGWFDGAYQELGHHFYLNEPDTPATPAGGALGAGDYSWRFTIEWYDRLGMVHRSASSPPVVATAAANDEGSIAVRAHGCAHPNQKGRTTKILTYRTLVNGSTHFQDSGVLSTGAPALLNQSMYGSTTVISEDADGTIDANPVIPLDGGEIEPIAPAGFKTVFGRRDRLFGVPWDSPTNLWVTKPLVLGVAPEFSDDLVYVFQEGGNINAGIVQDETIILFQERGIYAFAGEGPNALGQGGFTPARKLPSDTTAISQNGVVGCRLGTIFKSPKGFALLDRALNVDLTIGFPVTRYNDRDVLAAVPLENRDAIRFVLSGGTILDLDLTHRLWSTFELPKEAVHAASIGGVFHWLGKDGTVWREDPAAKTDGDTPFRMVLGTMWVKPSPNPEIRVWRLGLLGDVGDRDFSLKVSIYHDYDETTPVEVKEINMKEADLAPDGTLFVEITPARTRCKAIKLRIEDIDGKAQNLAFSTLTLDIGVAKRLGRQPGKRRV